MGAWEGSLAVWLASNQVEMLVISAMRSGSKKIYV